MRIILALALFAAVVVYSVPSAEGRHHRSWKKNSVGHHDDFPGAGSSRRHHRKHAPSSSSSSSSESESQENGQAPRHINKNKKTVLHPQIRLQNPRINVQNPQIHVDRPVIHKNVGGAPNAGVRPGNYGNDGDDDHNLRQRSADAATASPSGDEGSGRGFDASSMWSYMVSSAQSAKEAMASAAGNAHEKASAMFGNPQEAMAKARDYAKEGFTKTHELAKEGFTKAQDLAKEGMTKAKNMMPGAPGSSPPAQTA